VSWNNTDRQATITTAAYTVVFTIDSKTFTVNGTAKTLQNPARIKNDRTMVPIRAFAEAIGADVDYNSSTHTATVDYFTNMSGTLKISGSTTVQPISQAAADRLIAMNSSLSISVSGGGSGTGIKDAAAGTVNIGNSSRDLTEDELKGLTAYIVANDGIAIIVNPDNPVKNLTKEQAKDIFLGNIKNWKDVGGEDAPIFVMTRETGSGTLATLEEILLNKESVVSTASPCASSHLIKQAVAGSEYAIGFDSIGYVDSTVKVVSIDDIKPSDTTVINKTYVLSRQLYSCTKGTATGIAAVFIDYLRSRDCQDNIVRNEGYIRIS
jgi:phosphate transport system substrate-binding protein